jgi:D-glycero-alpha-D-manno-heptose-7-phosphate kinase
MTTLDGPPRYFRRRNDLRKVRAKAPLRLGLAGGGTDVSPYSEKFGGAVLNATIDMYAHCTVEVLDEDVVEFNALDLGQSFRSELRAQYAVDGELQLHKAVYNRIVRDYTKGSPLPLRITTYSDAPPGSGLGTSSTMVVSILAAFQELLKLPFGEYDVANLAFQIERHDVALSGGKQDQYAAAFGGFNFMEFHGEKVIINPLRIRDNIVNELQARMLLYFTGRSRSSAQIIEDQIKALNTHSSPSVESLHELKRVAHDMKECLLKNDLPGVAALFRSSWDSKKRIASSISNSNIDHVAELALSSGADAVKVSGAGGGGFMMIMVPPERRFDVLKAVAPKDENSDFFVKFNFTSQGVQSWGL